MEGRWMAITETVVDALPWLNFMVVMLLSIVGFFLVRVIRKIDELPLQIERAHSRITKVELEIALVRQRVYGDKGKS